jgi:MFS family permease
VLTLQTGGLVNSFGNGIVMPFLFIYLHNVRGIGLATAGLILATHAVASIVAGPVFGSQIDRFGGKAMLTLSLGILTFGYALYALVEVPWQGFVVAAVSGIGVGGFWPSQSTLIAGLTPVEQRPAAFAMQRVVMNLGFGVGALAGGLIAATDSPSSFTVLFLLDAASFLAYAVVMVALVASPPATPAHASGRPGSYRDVLRHRAFVAVAGLNALFIFAGYSGFDVLPVYAKNEAGLTETQIGVLFLVNTGVIILAQLPIARVARGRRRMPTLALFGILWCGAWLLVPLAGSASSATIAMALLVVVMAVFALGMCLHGAVAAPLVADLAAPHLLGRYMALNALSWQIGFALGPALGGVGLSASPTGVWLAASALCASGAALALVIEGALPPRARRTPGPAMVVSA